MAVMSAMLVGTVMGVLLQVEMVDRKIRMTSIDCSIEMDLLTSRSGRADHVLSPVVGLGSSVMH